MKPSRRNLTNAENKRAKFASGYPALSKYARKHRPINEDEAESQQPGKASGVTRPK